MTELKPCPNPWCERKFTPIRVSHVDPDGKADGFCVWCFNDCGIKGPVRTTEDDAVAAWNTRASATHTREGIASWYMRPDDGTDCPCFVARDE